ncbi:hypothetical protein Vi05172_g7224 [Venturia inaequalis]|uniref:Uncharacterized protein n=1 Tax=Venturia inaequalis TaxID=5025 RepID=A0A8H3ZBZ4_VENIN|nr:hypothetical protein EG327_005185 [Venturia inaequalis]RDI82739.1 hypothetical protein Vi05172_g7224 [Venturia inaequalis]
MAPQFDLTTARATQASHDTAVDVLQSSPFLRLPAELRNKIYRSLLIFDCALLPNFKVPEWYQYRSRATQYIDAKILRVNRQIYNEARDVLIKGNEFVYMEDHDFKNPEKYPQGSIHNAGTFQDAPKVRATFGSSGWNNEMYADCFELLAKNPNLIGLHITFDCLVPVHVEACRKALSLLEKVKVRDKVVLHFKPRIHYKNSQPTQAKRQKEFIETLKVLEKKMLEN